jgi:hypothetical protein
MFANEDSMLKFFMMAWKVKEGEIKNCTVEVIKVLKFWIEPKQDIKLCAVFSSVFLKES